MITARYSFDRKPVFLGGDVGNIGDENFCKVFGLLVLQALSWVILSLEWWRYPERDMLKA